jgi:hypothetical protein
MKLNTPKRGGVVQTKSEQCLDVEASEILMGRCCISLSSVRCQKFDSVALSLIIGMALFSSVLAAEGELTLLTNATTVEIGNEVQKISFDKGSDSKFRITTAVWDGSSWRPFFDGSHPLIEGSQFNLEPTTYSVLSNTTSKKSVRFSGARTSPTYAFDIEVEVDTASDLVKFQITSHLPSALTLTSPQPTVGLWMKRPYPQWAMQQEPISATRGAYPISFNFGFPATYLWDQEREAAIYLNMTPATWMSAHGLNRFLDVQIRTFSNGTQTGLGMYPYHLTGNTVRAGDMLVEFYLYSSWNPQSPEKLSDMLDRTMEQFQHLHPWTSVFPTNTLEGGEVSWRKIADRTMADLMVQNVTYGHRTNEPYNDSPLALVSLPTEMIVHPSFLVSNATEALHSWNFATINHSLIPSVLYTRLHNSPQMQQFVQLKKDALPRFYNSNSRIISSGTQQPSFVFSLEISWQTLVYYQEMLSLIDSLSKEDFNPAIGGRFLMGLEGLIQYAHQVNYLFSVYYDPFSKQPVSFQENPGLGAVREPWSVGSYSYIMLGGYEMTGNPKYLTEAQAAMNALMSTMSYTEANNYYTATYSDPIEMPVMELMGNSYGAIAALKLYRLTHDPKYLTYQRDFLNVLLRMTTWFEDQTDTVSRDLRNLGLFYPFVGAPTPTSWETAEANLCMAWLLKNDRTNARAPLLTRLSNLNRINSFYFFPATFTLAVRNLNPGLRQDVGQYFPTENMYTLEFPSGSGGSPSQTAIYMTGLSLWNSWLYEELAAASNRNILVLNLASLDDYEPALRSGRREFLVCNPTDTLISTTITNQHLEPGTYQVTVTDPGGAVLSSNSYSHDQLVAGQPIILAAREIVYLKIENANVSSILANIEAYRSAGKRLAYAYQLLQVTARDRGISTNLQQMQGVFGSAQQFYQAGDYASAYSKADQIVTNLAVPSLTLGITWVANAILTPSIVSFSSFFGSRSPTNLVNGSGLTTGASGILGAADSKHGNDVEGTMWYSNPYSTPPDDSPVVTFNLGGVYDLQSTRIWQYNQPGGFTVYGANDIEVSVSTDNTNFIVLKTITPARAGGTNGEPAQDFAMSAASVQYVRFHILDTFGGTQASGLSEVRFVSAKAGMAITLHGLVGQHYRVEYRDSLTQADSWQLLEDIPSLNSTPYVVNDPMPIRTQRFYRAVQLQ